MEICLNIEVDSANIDKADINELYKYFQKLICINKDISEKLNTHISNHLLMCSELSEVNLKKLDLTDWDVSSITDMHSMFEGCIELESLDVSNWNVSNVKDMHSMLLGCVSLKELDISKWNTSNVCDMSFMFYGCESLPEEIVLDVRSVKQMLDIFTGSSIKRAYLKNASVNLKDHYTSSDPNYNNYFNKDNTTEIIFI